MGARRSWIPCYTHAEGADAEQTLERVEALRERGYRKIRVQVGGYGGKNPGGDPADLTDMDADVVDQPGAHNGHPLVGVVEQLAHGQRGGALLPDGLEPRGLLRLKHVLQEKQAPISACRSGRTALMASTRR